MKNNSTKYRCSPQVVKRRSKWNKEATKRLKYRISTTPPLTILVTHPTITRDPFWFGTRSAQHQHYPQNTHRDPERGFADKKNRQETKERIYKIKWNSKQKNVDFILNLNFFFEKHRRSPTTFNFTQGQCTRQEQEHQHRVIREGEKQQQQQLETDFSLRSLSLSNNKTREQKQSNANAKEMKTLFIESKA